MTVIRDFEPDDQEQVRSLIQAGMKQRWGPAFDEGANPDTNDLHGSYIGAGGEIAVIEHDGLVIAAGALVDEGDGMGRLLRVSVAQSRQGSGIGQALVAHLVERARRRKLRMVRVSTDTPWTDALEFYRSCGFIETGESRGDTHFELELD